MSEPVDKMEAHEIKQMRKAGMSVPDIAYAMERDPKTIRAVLSGRPAERDTRADMHDRMLGPISSGCYDSDGEQVLFEDPTFDNAERLEFLERTENIEVSDFERLSEIAIKCEKE